MDTSESSWDPAATWLQWDEQPLNVLLVEDDSAAVRLLRRKLAAFSGKTVKLNVVNKLPTGMGQLNAAVIEVVLVGCSLLGAKDLDIISWVRSYATEVPIVVLTDLADTSKGVKAVRAGAQENLEMHELAGSSLMRALRHAVERHRLRQELEARMGELQAYADQLHLMFEKHADGIVLVDSAGVIRFVNPAAEILFGREANSLVGEMFGFPLVVGDTAELDMVRPNDEPAAVELRVVETQWDGETVLMASLRDVTARKQVQQAELAAQREAGLNRAKSEFLARMSHELRTPLTAILGYSEMLAEEAEKRALTDFSEDLGRITEAGQHLLALINDILDISKIEAGKLELVIAPFAVAELVDNVVSTVKPLMTKNSNRLEVVCPEDIGAMRSDETKVRQVLLNLLGNAAKFTNGGEVSLEVARESVDGADWLNFTVRDTGIGMSPEQLERVFAEFVQADGSISREFGGTGLGLAISRRLCLMMGGDMQVDSKLGAGSVFSVRLPRVSSCSEGV